MILVPPASPQPAPNQRRPWPGLLPLLAGALRRRGPATIRYLTQIEVHTFAFSVAANAILSFFPFVLLLLTLTRNVFHSPAMTNVVLDLMRDNLPTGQEFVVRNVRYLAGARRGIEIASLAILLITSTGVFLPLEVALNRVWGFPKNRSYLLNQLVSLGLAFVAGLLALLSVALTAGNQRALVFLMGGYEGFLFRVVAYLVMKFIAIVASIAIFFLIYWLLPNGKVPPRAVVPAAIIAGMLWELSKHAYIGALPWLNFQEVYGPFSISVTLMFWAFISGLILLGGAHLSAEEKQS
ncbi:MAG TPA: YihY/virulence factor BrkB family protein [Terriglobales bacterium]|nr:YihY/virulence factor BrkB family protein [Terriglobales bacterium]